MNPVAAGGVVADARIALIDAIVGDMQRGRSYYDVVVRQLLALRKTFTDPPPYAGLVLACDLEECQKKLATAKTIIVDEMSVIRSLQHERSAAQAEADRLRIRNTVVVGWEEALAEISADEGRWQACTGCYETEDGQPVGKYPYSTLLGCMLGGGCHECGGLGAVWDMTNYADFADTASHAAKTEQERGE